MGVTLCMARLHGRTNLIFSDRARPSLSFACHLACHYVYCLKGLLAAFLGCFNNNSFFILYFQGKARLGAVVHKKNATALAITAVKNVSYLALMGVVLASCCAARVSRAQRI